LSTIQKETLPMLEVARMSLADARTLIQGVAQRAEEIGVPMCIAVADESGNLIAFERMDGAKVLSIEIARDKAMVAAAQRKSTADYNRAVQAEGSLTFGIHTAIGGRFSIVGGGLPVTVDGQVVGAVGCSSGTPDQDGDCAQAGIDRFLGER
jgi:uncharacterized protein GlcG (DUF336 family)